MAASSLALLFGAMPALAQSGQAVALSPPPTGAEPAELDAVVVTAQRREQSANTIPLSIQAFSAEQLEAVRVTDVGDLSLVAPSFTVAKGYQGIPIYTLRGIGFNTINLSSTSTVGTYVDEVAYPFPFMNAGPIFDVQRVEVLKGPQGTLYGRNTTAGLVDFITNKPSATFGAGASAEIGNYRTHNLEAYVTGPIGPDLLGRLAFRTEDSDRGWQKSQSRPGERLGEVHRYGVRGTLAYAPNASFRAELSVSGWINSSDTLAAQAIGFTPATAASPFNAPGLAQFVAANPPSKASQADWAPASRRAADIGRGRGLDDPLKEDDEFYATRLRLEYVFDDMKLVSLTGYNHVRRDATFDASGAPYELGVQQVAGRIGSLSEELHLEGETGRATWVVGAYYGHDNIHDSARTLLGENANVGLIRSLTTSLLGTPFNAAGYTAADAATTFRSFVDFGNMTSVTKSLFASADWKLTDEMSLTTGIRYTKDRQRAIGCTRDDEGADLPNVNIASRFLYNQTYGVSLAPIGVNQCATFDPTIPAFALGRTRVADDNLAYRVALDWRPREGVLIYGALSRGAKAGTIPINSANVSVQNLPVKQELITAYELGVKAALLDRKLQLNGAGFYYDYDDKQLSVFVADPIYTALVRLSNIPKAEAYGFDGDVTWRLHPAVTWITSLTYVHTAVGGYVGVNQAGRPQNFKGAEFPYSPTWQTSSTLIFDRDLNDKFGMQVTLNGRWQSASHADLGQDAQYRIKSYGLLNGSLRVYTLDDRYDVAVWGKNLTNTYTWTSVGSGANTVVRFPGQPRTFGATLTARY